MKKKILFVMESLRIGGAEKSLLTILSMLDYSRYDVDLFLFKTDGEWMEFLPKEVNLLNSSEDYEIFSENRKLAPLRFLKKLDFRLFYHSFVYLIKCLYYKMIGKLYIGWEHVQYMFPEVGKEYDTSIAFLERKTIYFNIDKVKAIKKIGFIHNDYSVYDYDYKNDLYYFENYRNIATVSLHCKDVLCEIFPEYKEKFLVIKNMVSKEMMNQMAQERLPVEKKETFRIVTVARLVEQKGIDRAIDVCKMLVEHGYDVKWYVVGGGPEEEKLKKKIVENSLQERLILVGAQKNPYHWIKNCDLYVQPSRFEGFGITVCEAKALAKPILTSDIPEFREQIIDGWNGYLAKDEEMMYNRIKEIFENASGIRDKFIKNLENDERIENREELEKLYEVLEEN